MLNKKKKCNKIYLIINYIVITLTIYCVTNIEIILIIFEYYKNNQIIQTVLIM